MSKSNGLVEVYDPAQRCYIPGYLVDIDKSRVQVQFELTTGQLAGAAKWFEWSTVREVPPYTGPYQLTEGQAVEVSYVDEGTTDPPAWWEAKIVSKKGPYCKVHFLCGSFPDEAIEEDNIRPATNTITGKPMYCKQTIPISDRNIHARFLQNEQELVGKMREKAQLLSVVVEKTKPQLKLIGSQKSIEMAKMLIELQKKHFSELESVHSHREKLAERLETEKSKRETGVRIEFAIDKELIGLVVGKGGKNIADARRETGVDVVEIDQNGPRVVIIGPTQQSVEAAREKLEFVTAKLPVDPEQIGWLIGKGGKNFKDLQDKTKVTRLNIDKATSQVILVGTSTAVAAAQLYIDTHLEHRAAYDKEVGENDALIREIKGMGLENGEPTLNGKGKGKGGRGAGAGGSNGGRGGGAGGRGGGGRSDVQTASPPLAAAPKEEVSGAPPASGTGAVGRAPGGPKRDNARPSARGGKPTANGDGGNGAVPVSTPRAEGGGGKGKGKGKGSEPKRETEEGAAKADPPAAPRADAKDANKDAAPQRANGRGRGGGGGGGGDGRGRGKGRGASTASSA